MATKAKAMKLKVYTINTLSCSILYVSAGWVILQQTTSESVVAGFNRAFLTNSQEAVADAIPEIEADLASSEKTCEKEWAQMLKDILIAEVSLGNHSRYASALGLCICCSRLPINRSTGTMFS